MGYASYFEDITRRLDEAVSAARERRFSQDVAGKDVRLSRDLELLISLAKREIERLKRLTDLATDKELDRAQKILDLLAENGHLRKTIEISSDGKLAERYYSLEAENFRLQSLIDKDLVDEFYELDNKYVQLQERERKLLDHEKLLLDKLRAVKQTHTEYVGLQHSIVQDLQDKVKALENLIEIHRAEDRNRIRHIESLDSVIAKKDDEIVDLTQQNATLQKRLSDLIDELEFVTNPVEAYQRYSDPS